MTTEKVYVQFADASRSRVIAIFGGPQDPAAWPNMGEIDITDARYLACIACMSGASNSAPTIASLCAEIDHEADLARVAVAGDPLRAVEYQRAADEAQAFKDAGYPQAVPPMVAAWAIGGRTAKQAADNILAEAAAYNGALVWLRTTRLAAKEQVREMMESEQYEAARTLASATVSAIRASVAGVGNNDASAGGEQ